MLGQPLRAEVEIMATREELVNMSAQIAQEDAFRQMGLDYALILSKIEFEVGKRSNGQPIIKLSTKSPVNDPFIDMLLELSWPSGRLVREYTFLLDPQEVMEKKSESSATQVANIPRASAPVQLASSSSDADASSRIGDDTRVRALGRGAAVDDIRPPASSSASSASSGARTVQVKEGDTLYSIARSVRPEGVSLDQVLVGLFRANRDAFDGRNMNRLKSGRILTVPEREDIGKVSSREAKRVFVVQSSNWNAYQSRLASAAAQMPAQEGQSRQGAVGRITAKVEDAAAPAIERKDRVRVSRTRSGGRPREEDRIVRDKAISEANERIQALENSVANLQKLITMKDQSLAELQQRLSKPPQLPAQSAPTPSASPAQPEQPAQAAQPAPQAQASPQVAPPSPPAATQPQRPAPQRPRPVIPPPPPEEPGIIDVLFGNWLLIVGGLGTLALLGGGAYFFLRWYRKRKEEEISLDSIMTMSDDTEDLGSQSVFQDMGGESVDTSRSPQSKSGMSDFSQANPGSIDTEEVDVIAEADMYMTFNRDAQAEEVLLEAKQKDPSRHDIH
ncbi:MAG: LysM peptidoglycan-binding domain-containing protein, partial [Candidatus Accumulibacter sp.]|nr:LysM peptidoglycan-binding domain-containing protein [Accumulibacter sp.]